MSEDEQGTFGRIHVHGYSCQSGDVVPPDSGGVDHDGCTEFRALFCLGVIGLHADDAVLFADESGHFLIGQGDGTVCTCIQDVGNGQAERVNGAVGYLDSTGQRRVDRRFETNGLFRVDCFGFNARLTATLHEFVLIGEVVFGKGNEQSAVFLHTVGGNAA